MADGTYRLNAVHYGVSATPAVFRDCCKHELPDSLSVYLFSIAVTSCAVVDFAFQESLPISFPRTSMAESSHCALPIWGQFVD
jgi:hypothetical protein